MTDFVEVKTNELTGGGLNWAVAKAEGYEPMLFPHSRNEYGVVASLGSVEEGNFTFKSCVYCTDWSQGGPLIESEELTVEPSAWDWKGACVLWRAQQEGESVYFEHTNILVAAMRAIAHAKLGDTASVPKELLT